MSLYFSFQAKDKQIYILLTATKIQILSVQMEFHKDFAKKKNLELTLTLAFVTRSSIVVLQGNMLKHALLALLSIRFFSIATGQGF